MSDIKYTNERVTVGANGEFPLPGVLSVPVTSEKLPAVVLVHGSGPQDMDEKIYANSPFRDLADELASRGIAVLRYDKRTYVHAEALLLAGIGDLTVVGETIEDAILAAELLRHDARIDPNRVFVLGHSLGGMLAPRIDAEGGDFAGIIILAGSPRKLKDIMLDQIAAQAKSVPDGMSDDDIAAINEQILTLTDMLNGIDEISEDDAKTILIAGASGYYFKEMDAHPSQDYLSSASTKPVLILQGGRDVQVYADTDFRLYQEQLAGHRNTTFRLYPELNHLFIESTNGTADDYLVAGRVDERVADDIAAWIRAI